jgi:hypothetical protein
MANYINQAQEEIDIICPYCGEMIAVLVDSSSGSQEYYEDCSVCCASILFSLVVNPEGNIASIDVKRDDE